MLFTHPDPDHDVNRPIATHSWRKSDRAIIIALLKLLELPATSLRRQALERMIKRVEMISLSHTTS